MALDLPLYLIVGRKPVSWERTADGGSILLGWDFDAKEMTIEAASWDDVVDLTPGVPVTDQLEFTEGDTVRVTKAQFDAAVKKLKAE